MLAAVQKLMDGTTKIFCPEMERVAPVDGCVRPVMVRVPVELSTSVSLTVTGMRKLVSSVPVAVSLLA